MNSFESILLNLQDWGYWLVFFGSMVEGELILLSASAAASLGYLDVYKVFTIAFLTTVFVDQGLFFLGRHIGTDWIVKRVSKLEKARNKAFSFLRKMEIFFIFSFRFIYGIRTISPLIIGSAGISPLKFILCNIVSGFVWAGGSCWLGYKIADTISDGTFDYKDLILYMSVAIVVGALVACLITKRKHN